MISMESPRRHGHVKLDGDDASHSTRPGHAVCTLGRDRQLGGLKCSWMRIRMDAAGNSSIEKRLEHSGTLALLAEDVASAFEQGRHRAPNNPDGRCREFTCLPDWAPALVDVLEDFALRAPQLPFFLPACTLQPAALSRLHRLPDSFLILLRI